MRITLLSLLLACGDYQPSGAADATPLQTEASFSAPAAGAWPLHARDSWRFFDRAISVTSASQTSAVVSGLFKQPRTFSYDANAAVLRVWTPELQSWEPLVRFDADVGESWELRTDNGGCGRLLATITETDTVAKTSAGAFPGARVVTYVLQPDANVRCAAPDFDAVTVVPGFGPVAVGKALLQGATVDSADFPVARHLTLAQVTGAPDNVGEAPFVLDATVSTGMPACTDRYCKMGCCNICATHFMAGDMALRAFAPTRFGCVGDECNPTKSCEPLVIGEQYALTGKLRKADNGAYELAVISY